MLIQLEISIYRGQCSGHSGIKIGLWGQINQSLSSFQHKMWWYKLLLLVNILNICQSTNITRFDLMQYFYQKPLNHGNQTLTVKGYINIVEAFKEDMNFIDQAMDSLLLEMFGPNFHKNITNLDIGKYMRNRAGSIIEQVA